MEESKSDNTESFGDFAHRLARLSKKITRCLGCLGGGADAFDLRTVVREVAEEALDVFEEASEIMDEMENVVVTAN